MFDKIKINSLHTNPNSFRGGNQKHPKLLWTYYGFVVKYSKLVLCFMPCYAIYWGHAYFIFSFLR